MKMGRTGTPLEPRRRPHAGKSGYPRSQNADSSPRAQGAPRLGLAEKERGKCEAPRAPTACGIGRRVAIDWTWASLLPHDASATARIDNSLHAKWVMITCDRGGRWLASPGYMYETARALPVHPFLLLPFFFLAAHHPHGPVEEVLGCGERKGSPGRAWLSSGQAWPGLPSQVPYGPCCGFPWSWKQSYARWRALGCRREVCWGCATPQAMLPLGGGAAGVSRVVGGPDHHLALAPPLLGR